MNRPPRALVTSISRRSTLAVVAAALVAAGVAASGGCQREQSSLAPAGSAAGALLGSGGPARAGSAVAGPRLVSLTPSATEIVAALGAVQLLVGVDNYSAFPPEVAQLPKVGSFLAPNLETIIGLRPTLVIVDDVHGQVAGALHDAGIASVACPMHALADVKAGLAAVGQRIDKTAEADQAIAGIDAAVKQAVEHQPAVRPRVLAVIDRESGGLGGIVAAGPDSWVDELLAVVGGYNVLEAASTRYPKISVEEVLRAKPDVIVDLSYAARQGAAAMAAWKSLDVPAVKSGRIRALDDAYLAAPSPRVAEALAALAKAIQ